MGNSAPLIPVPSHKMSKFSQSFNFDIQSQMLQYLKVGVHVTGIKRFTYLSPINKTPWPHIVVKVIKS